MAKAAKRRRQKEQRRQRIAEEVKRHRARRTRRLAINFTILAVVLAAIAGTVLASRQDRGAEPGDEDKQEQAQVACDGEIPAKGDTTPEPEPPPMSIDSAKTYSARIETSCGDIEIELAADISPNTVNSFVYLARRTFFDGLTFHRVAEGFVIQGGDPQGDGMGGPGYQVFDVPPAEYPYPRGTVAMAKTPNDPPGTSGSQFFFVLVDSPPSLIGSAESPAQYAVLGTITSGLEVLDTIASLSTDPQPSNPSERSLPRLTIYIERVLIRES